MPLIKLNDDLKRRIREFVGQGRTKTEASKEFKVSNATVYRVITGKMSRSHLPRHIIRKSDGKFFNEHERENWLV